MSDNLENKHLKYCLKFCTEMDNLCFLYHNNEMQQGKKENNEK